MTWELRLECRDCGAELRYIDERPQWEGTGAERYVTCPACDGRAVIQHAGIDLGLDKAFGMFRSKVR